MSLTTWRQFQFFENTPIRDPNFGTDSPLYSDNSTSAICSSLDYLVISTDNCTIKIINREFSFLKEFVAYPIGYNVTFLKSLANSNLVVTLAEQQGLPSIIKLWDLSKILSLTETNEEDYEHKFHTVVNVTNGDNSFPISCLEINEEFTVIAIGYTNGKVIIIRGDLLRDRGSRQRLVYESNDPITGLKFRNDQLLLYITTTSKVLTVPTNGRNQGKPHRILDKLSGVDLNCCDIDKDSQELIVGRDDSLAYYNHLGKSHSINFEAPKRRIYKKGKYLMMISPVETSRTVAQSMILDTVNGGSLTTRIIIIDLIAKHISFTLTISNTINQIFEMRGDIYLLSSDGVLHKVHEKSLNRQIEIIIQRNLYPTAIQLAQDSNVSKTELLRIYSKYGDYLYSKNQFGDAMQQYLTYLEIYSESNDERENLTNFIMEIIQKFKDISNINDMTLFLAKLYDLNLSNNDHLTLLLCCYCKLKKVDQIDSFISSLDLESANPSPSKVNFQELNFQLIINLLRECKYFSQAINLLYKLKQPNIIVEIQLNDLKTYKTCINFIKTLPIDDCLRILIDYSKLLLDNTPNEATELLIGVFTGRYIPEGSPESIINLAPSQLTHQEDEPKTGDSLTSAMFPLNSYKAFVTFMSGGADRDSNSDISSIAASIEPTYLPPKPRIIFPSFINKPNEFVIFLEACIESYDKYQGNVKDKKDILITLFEMYLSLADTSDDLESRQIWEGKARDLAEKENELMDSSLLLLISNVNNFNEGEMLARDKSGFEIDLFRSCVVSQDVSGALKILNKYGPLQSELYKLALNFIISTQEIFDECGIENFKEILTQIKLKKLMTPLDIIQTLSINNIATIGLIKDYLIEFITQQKQEIENNEKLIESYSSETDVKKKQLDELLNKPMVLQNTKCSLCHLKLDFPIVHFKCKHSFHQRCIDEDSSTHSDNEVHCPLCANDVSQIEALRQSQVDSKERFDLFKSSLSDSEDRFRVISEFFGRGVMESDVYVYDDI